MLILDFVESNPQTLALNGAEQPVTMRPPLRVDGAALGSGLETGGGLLDVDVGEELGGGVGRAGGCGVLVDVECDGGGADGSAEEPGDALDGEDGVDGIGEGLVLEVKLGGMYD